MQDGPEKVKEQCITKRFTDATGTTYDVGAFLGGGVEGKTFLGTVVSLGKNADPRLQKGSEVAIKQQSISGTGNDEEQRVVLNREIDILNKEGSFFGSAEEPFKDKTYLLMAIPVIKGKTLRDRLYEIDDTEPDQNKSYVAKKVLTPQEKASFSYQILRDYAAQQMLSLLHVDIKPDNVLVTDDGKLKVIDWGNSWDRDKSEEHPKDFQSPGALYAAPENYDDVMDKKDRKCSVKADEYAIGMMLASIWTNSFYEKDANLNAVPGNDALGARQSLNDILGPTAQKPADMPEDLFKIIRHLAAINPTERPECIALANGMRESTTPMMQEIVKANARLETVAKEVVSGLAIEDFRDMARANGKKALQDFDVQVQPGTQPPDPTADFRKLQEYMDRLQAINAEHAITLPVRVNQINRLEKAYNDVLNEMINSGNPHFKKIAEKAESLDGKPAAKMQQVLKDYKKIAPDVIQAGFKTASLEGEIYLRLNNILKNAKDPISLRIEIADLYSQVKTLSLTDKEHKKQYKPIEAHLNKMLDKLDNARTLEARQLQGQAPQAPQLQGTSIPQPTTKARRKRSYMSRARSFLRALLDPDPVKIARQVATHMQATGASPQQTQPTTPSSSQTKPQSVPPPISVGSLQTILAIDQTPPAKDLNPLALPSSHTMQFSRGSPAQSFGQKRPRSEPALMIAVRSLISALMHVESRTPNISPTTLNSIAQTVQKQVGSELTSQTKKELDMVVQDTQPESQKKKLSS